MYSNIENTTQRNYFYIMQFCNFPSMVPKIYKLFSFNGGSLVEQCLKTFRASMKYQKIKHAPFRPRERAGNGEFPNFDFCG